MYLVSSVSYQVRKLMKPIRDYEEYVGKEMQFKVVKVNESFRNVVVSHKALIEADLVVQTKEIMSKLEKGQVS